MTISKDHIWINSLSMFTAWNDKNGDDKDYRRESTKEQGRFECIT